MKDQEEEDEEQEEEEDADDEDDDTGNKQEKDKKRSMMIVIAVIIAAGQTADHLIRVCIMIVTMQLDTTTALLRYTFLARATGLGTFAAAQS